MTYETFGQWLKQRRKALDLTQEALARRAGCAAVTLRKLEADQIRPSLELAERLAQFLEIPPGELEAFTRLARGLPAPEPAGYDPSTNPTRPHPTNLVPPLTPLIGREADLDRLASLLQRKEIRLVTLYGPPGIGKTRLSLQAGRNVLPQFPDGVFFVPLAPISDPGLAPRTIAQALGIPETARQSLLDSLKVSLRDRQILLILDNFEHLLEAAPLVGELLDAAPRLKVLATSREALNLYGEIEFKMQPLALPGPADLESLDTLAEIASVRLFVQRAQAVNADFTLNRANAAAVIEVCTRLDGLPLAIELAAARSNLFGPRALLKRLDHRLELLTSGARNLPPRQRTLRGAIEWSYSLLDESERALYRRLGVFAGSFDLEAAAAVAGAAASADAAADEFTPDGVLAVLASLVAKSLLLRISLEGEDPGEPDEEDEPRFMMLETLREHAREQLELSGEAELIRGRHARYYLALAETAYPQQVGFIPEVRRWVKRLELERPNSLAALHWLVDRGEVELSLRLTGAMWPFWAIRGYLSEGRQALQAALELAQGKDLPPSQTGFLALASNGAGHLAYDQGDHEAARPLIETSLNIWKELGDAKRTAWALYGMALAGRQESSEDARRRLLAESIAVSRAAGDRWCLARALELLSAIQMYDSKFEAAQAAVEECLPIFRELSDAEGIGLSLHTIGRLAHRQGRFAEAWQALEEARAIFSELDYRPQLAWVYYSLGHLAQDEGRFDLARTNYLQSQDMFRQLGTWYGLVWTPLALGLIARRQGDPEQARLLLHESLEHPQGPPLARALAHYGLGLLALDEGDPAAALDSLEVSLDSYYASEGWREVAALLEAVARAAGQAGRAGEAARLFGAAEALRQEIGAPQPPSERDDYQPCLDALRSALGPEAFSREWAAGRELPPPEAVALAQEIRTWAFSG